MPLARVRWTEPNHSRTKTIMGDRANIAVLQGATDAEQNPQIWIYTHWAGLELWQRLQAGLKAGENRWGDESYLTRILFVNSLVSPAQRSDKDGATGTVEKLFQETGAGISTAITDNEYPVLVVDVPNARVYVIQESWLKDGKVPAGYKPKQTWTFKAFLELAEDPRSL